MSTAIKTGGRQQGTPNKLTKELREKLKVIMDVELDGINEMLNTLKPKQRIELIIKLLPYVLPKVEAVNYTENEPMDLIGW
jgi:hypothetical protein